MAVAVRAMVPLLNVLAFYRPLPLRRRTAASSSGQIVRAFVANPFIWSCAVGLA